MAGKLIFPESATKWFYTGGQLLLWFIHPERRMDGSGLCPRGRSGSHVRGPESTEQGGGETDS